MQNVYITQRSYRCILLPLSSLHHVLQFLKFAPGSRYDRDSTDSVIQCCWGHGSPHTLGTLIAHLGMTRIEHSKTR